MKSKFYFFAVSLFCVLFLTTLCSGCKLFQEMYNPPKKKKKAPAKADNSPVTFPNGTTTGLNSYERDYIKSINQEFEKQREINKKRVFGG